MPALSVVVPMHNEARSAGELIERTRAAIHGMDAEIIVADDASTDDTAVVAETCGARVVRLPVNVGQFRATLAGVGHAEGDWVAVLDGDLQDPPETLADLWATAQEPASVAANVDVVFAVKVARYERLWMRIGAAVYHAAQRLAAGASLPAGAGSYCLMRREVAAKVARVRLPDANLAAVLTALGTTHRTCPYEKQDRRDGDSRMGLAGLTREAMGSLAVTGVTARAGVAVGAVLAGAAWWTHGAHPLLAALLGASGLAVLGFGVASSRRARTLLDA